MLHIRAIGVLSTSSIQRTVHKIPSQFETVFPLEKIHGSQDIRDAYGKINKLAQESYAVKVKTYPSSFSGACLSHTAVARQRNISLAVR